MQMEQILARFHGKPCKAAERRCSTAGVLGLVIMGLAHGVHPYPELQRGVIQPTQAESTTMVDKGEVA